MSEVWLNALACDTARPAPCVVHGVYTGIICQPGEEPRAMPVADDEGT